MFCRLTHCRLRFVSERADYSETLMYVAIPERAGAIRELYRLISPRNVTELSYRWSDPKLANVVVSLQSLKGTHGLHLFCVHIFKPPFCDIHDNCEWSFKDIYSASSLLILNIYLFEIFVSMSFSLTCHELSQASPWMRTARW